MRLLFFLLWFLTISAAVFFLPAYDGGDLGEEKKVLVPVYAVIAGLAAIGVRGRAESAREALLSALPVLALLGAAAVWGYFENEDRAQYRGGPAYLYFGVALWASWAALVLSTALVARTKWNGPMGIGIGFLVALFGNLLFVARID